MNTNLITKWFKDLRWGLRPPGCFVDFVESPIDSERLCVNVGIVYEHRFAFYYWARFYHECRERYRQIFSNNPILISIDYHNDVGADADCKQSDLEQLNLNDETELSLFCWCYLNPLNDGHILPALYLDFFSDVYVLNKNKQTLCCDRFYEDRYHNKHEIKYFHEIDTLVDQLATINSPIYLDIDLDYFTNYFDREEKLGSSKMHTPQRIRDILNLKNSLMSKIFPNLAGLTIALEPKHSGGFNQSMKIFDILNSEFFDNTLLTDSCVWKYKI